MSSSPQPEHETQGGTARIDDPDAYNAARRLRQIHNAKERVPETIREESRNVVSDTREDGITDERYRELVSDVLIDYIIEVEPLMRHPDLDTQQTDYWNDETVTTVNGTDITLKYIVEHNGYVPSETDGQDSRPLQISTARTAYRLVNRFLSDVGLGVELHHGMPREEGFNAVTKEDDGA